MNERKKERKKEKKERKKYDRKLQTGFDPGRLSSLTDKIINLARSATLSLTAEGLGVWIISLKRNNYQKHFIFNIFLFTN